LLEDFVAATGILPLQTGNPARSIGHAYALGTHTTKSGAGC
jgi:hypothetical protein